MYSLALNLPLHRLEAAEAVRLAERARGLGEPGRPRGVIERMGLAISKVLAGDPEGRLMALELAAAMTEAPRQVSGVAWALVWAEEYGAARSLLGGAARMQRSAGALRYLSQALHPLAELDFRVGRWVSAYAHSYEAIDLFEETGQRAELGFVHGTVARLDAASGNDAECRAHAQAAFDSDAASGLAIASAYANAALGLLELGQGNAEAAVPYLEWVEQLATDGGLGGPWVVHWAPDLVESCSRIGDFDRARSVLETFAARAIATGHVSALAAAARCRGILAVGGEYATEFDTALSLHAQTDAPFECARTELAYGECLRRDGNRSQARSRLRSALARFERLGARPWAERARAELRASGQTVRTPAERLQDGLTPQEIQVAALVAGGATNRETAAALFLSGKTIEFHLRNVYRKLGIRSRTELAVILRPAA
jgi:DNA-binding CsgD family transcriptional regulator